MANMILKRNQNVRLKEMDSEDNRMNSQLNSSPEKSELGFSSTVSFLNAEETLIDKFKNADLNLDSIDRKFVLDDTEPFDGGAAYMLPLRPDAGDCTHYMRTGACKFGVTCRFNHPVTRTEQVVVKNKYQSSGKFTKTECKYYSRAGGCKYGIFCKFGHSKKRADTKFNVIGLPIRSEEKECSYYMRYGSCGYGAECVYHHPEPTLIGGFDTLDPSFEDESVIKSGYSFGNSNSESSALVPGASQPIQGSWFSNPSSCKTPVYTNDNSSDETANSYLQGTTKNSEWSAHQVPYVIHESSTEADLSTEENRDNITLESSLLSPKVEEYSEQLSQTLCSYLLKDGECKFKSSCRFYHPENWVPMSSGRVLSDKGLPLRPDREVCRHYRRFGICKFGSACLFDHPIDLALAPVTNTHRALIEIGEDSDI